MRRSTGGCAINLCAVSTPRAGAADKMNINLMRNTPTIGATLALDLASALRAGGAAKHDAIEQVYTALIEHLVVFIEDLVLTPAEQIDFALQFGALDVPHPIIQIHPVTGRTFLYVNPSFTKHIVGLKKSDSDRLLRYLYDHANQPEFQVCYHWRPNALALWDNRVTQHYAVADYLPEYRKMHRVTVINDRRSP